MRDRVPRHTPSPATLIVLAILTLLTTPPTHAGELLQPPPVPGHGSGGLLHHGGDPPDDVAAVLPQIVPDGEAPGSLRSAPSVPDHRPDPEGGGETALQMLAHLRRRQDVGHPRQEQRSLLLLYSDLLGRGETHREAGGDDETQSGDRRGSHRRTSPASR